MWALDYSLNLMTLLALSLVIGILVDDSIVVLENIHHHLELKEHPWEAALKGRNEIGFAALSITLVDVVVFVPLTLIVGLVGDIMREFAVVIVVSTLMSLFVSFTLTPMLASRFSRLQRLSRRSPAGWMAGAFEKGFQRLVERYLVLLRNSLDNRWKYFAAAVLLFVAAIALPALGLVGSEFIKASDRGEFIVNLEVPPGSTLEHTSRIAQQIERIIGEMPETRKIMPNVGLGAGNTTASNVTSLKLSFFLPTVSAFGTYSRRFASSEIVSPFQLPALSSAPAPATPGEAFLYTVLGSLSPALPDGNNWSVGIQLSLNLFSGMGTRAAQEKSAIQIEQYGIQREAISEKVELRIRAEMERAKASKFAMDQATHQQDAARKTLDIVTEAYSRGAVSILSLLDAQNGALRADQVAANALYDFWISSLLLQRAIGQFDVLMAPEEREDFLNRLSSKIGSGKKR